MLFFFAVIITSSQERFAEGASRVWSDCYRFLINMAFAVYLLENAILVLSRDGAFAHFWKPHRGFFVWTAKPHLGAFSAFPEKKRQMLGGGWVRLELTEPLFANQIELLPECSLSWPAPFQSGSLIGYLCLDETVSVPNFIIYILRNTHQKAMS